VPLFFFGDNRVSAVAVSYPEQSFYEIERAWLIYHKAVACAGLEATRSSISTSAGIRPGPPQSGLVMDFCSWIGNYFGLLKDFCW
jgi:hypothetical protein